MKFDKIHLPTSIQTGKHSISILYYICYIRNFFVRQWLGFLNNSRNWNFYYKIQWYENLYLISDLFLHLLSTRYRIRSFPNFRVFETCHTCFQPFILWSLTSLKTYLQTYHITIFSSLIVTSRMFH